MTRQGLAALPALPKSARKDRPKHPCACGCGFETASRFLPGHDSRLRGWVLRVERGVVKLADIPDGERQAVAAAMKAEGKTAKPTLVKEAKGRNRGGKPKPAAQPVSEPAAAEPTTEQQPGA